MTVNHAFESDKKSETVAATVGEKGTVANVSNQQITNGNGAHNIELDTYFADERIAVPNKVSEVVDCIYFESFKI